MTKEELVFIKNNVDNIDTLKEALTVAIDMIIDKDTDINEKIKDEKVYNNIAYQVRYNDRVLEGQQLFNSHVGEEEDLDVNLLALYNDRKKMHSLALRFEDEISCESGDIENTVTNKFIEEELGGNNNEQE